MAITPRPKSISHLALILLITTISACTTAPVTTSPIHYPIGPAHARYGQILGQNILNMMNAHQDVAVLSL